MGLRTLLLSFALALVVHAQLYVFQPIVADVSGPFVNVFRASEPDNWFASCIAGPSGPSGPADCGVLPALPASGATVQLDTTAFCQPPPS